MRIDHIRLQNFRGYKDISLDLHPNFNVIIGINGTGKTALLEGLRISAGSLFIGMDKVKDKLLSPGINKKKDVYISNFEKQWPVAISSQGTVFSNDIKWKRTLSSEYSATTTKDADEIKNASTLIQGEVKNGISEHILPLVAFYSIDRFKLNKAEDKGIEPYGSRLRGYYGSLDESTNLNFFLKLFRTETLAGIQENKPSTILKIVEGAIKSFIENCSKVYHHIRSDELVVEFTDNRTLPFRLLSEGTRMTLAIVMEISFRCYLLNFGRLGEDCIKLTDGVVSCQVNFVCN